MKLLVQDIDLQGMGIQGILYSLLPLKIILEISDSFTAVPSLVSSFLFPVITDLLK